MTEPKPPEWWQPPPPELRAPVRPERPRYRERRPVYWWTVLLGIVGSVVWYVLIGAAAWSTTSLVVGMLVGMGLAMAASWLLADRGDPGLGIGVGMMIGFTMSFMVLLTSCAVLFDSSGLG